MSDKGTLPAELSGLPLDRMLWAAGIAIGGYIVVHYLMALARRGIGKLPLDGSLRQFLTASIRLALLFIVLLMACDALGVPISSLIALLGVVGLAVSLAVQSLLGNVASGLLLLIAKPFTAGDFIESGQISGVVDSVSLLYTRLTAGSNRTIFVPNAQLTSVEITNHTLMPARRLELTIAAPFSAKVDDVKKLLLGAVQTVAEVRPEPAPFVGIGTIQGGRIDYLVRAWSASADYAAAQINIQEAIKRAFESAGLDRPSDALDVRLIPQ